MHLIGGKAPPSLVVCFIQWWMYSYISDSRAHHLSWEGIKFQELPLMICGPEYMLTRIHMENLVMIINGVFLDFFFFGKRLNFTVQGKMIQSQQKQSRHTGPENQGGACGPDNRWYTHVQQMDDTSLMRLVSGSNMV